MPIPIWLPARYASGRLLKPLPSSKDLAPLVLQLALHLGVLRIAGVVDLGDAIRMNADGRYDEIGVRLRDLEHPMRVAQILGDHQRAPHARRTRPSA